MDNNDKKVYPLLQSVERALKILSLFSEQQKDLSLSEISRLLDTSLPVTLKYLNTLQAHGCVKRAPSNKRYSLGYELIKLGNLAKNSNPLKEIAHSVMARLSNETGESVYLLVPDLPFYQAVCIDSVESPQPVISKFRMSAPLYAGSSKKSILAFLGDEYLQSLLSNIELIPLTKNTVIDPDLLIKQIKEIRACGYDISIEESVHDAGAIAAPIFDSYGIVGSICLFIPLYRFSQERKPLLIELTLKATNDISKLLGYNKFENY